MNIIVTWDKLPLFCIPTLPSNYNNCISFLLLPEQITTNLVAYKNTNLLSYHLLSIQKSKIDLHRLNLKCWQGRVLSEALKKNLFPCLEAGYLHSLPCTHPVPASFGSLPDYDFLPPSFIFKKFLLITLGPFWIFQNNLHIIRAD